ncbi:MAG: flagellar export chaperone FlgN, partial [Oscillospiraceae bacterium]
EHVKNEEVFLLKCRGFEVKRQAFLKELGLENMLMRDVIKQAPEEMREQLDSVFSELSEAILDLKEINNRCNSMIELRLHKIEKTLNQLEESKQKSQKGPTKGEKKFTDFISRKV